MVILFFVFILVSLLEYFFRCLMILCLLIFKSEGGKSWFRTLYTWAGLVNWLASFYSDGWMSVDPQYFLSGGFFLLRFCYSFYREETSDFFFLLGVEVEVTFAFCSSL